MGSSSGPDRRSRASGASLGRSAGRASIILGASPLAALVCMPAIIGVLWVILTPKPQGGHHEGLGYILLLPFLVLIAAALGAIAAGLVVGIVAVVRGDRRNGWIGIALCLFWPALLIVLAALGLLGSVR